MRRDWVLVCIVVVLIGYSFCLRVTPADAQQTFLPPLFQPGTVLTLNADPSVTYAVVSQQGAWIRVQREPAEQAFKEVWIYAPTGTVWTRVK